MSAKKASCKEVSASVVQWLRMLSCGLRDQGSIPGQDNIFSHPCGTFFQSQRPPACKIYLDHQAEENVDTRLPGESWSPTVESEEDELFIELLTVIDKL